MRAPNSQSSLRATSSSLLALLVLFIIVASPAYTRSVRNSQNQQEEIRLLDHGIIEEKFNSQIQRSDDSSVRKDDDLPKASVGHEELPTEVDNGHARRKVEAETVGKSTINSSFTSTKINEERAKNERIEKHRKTFLDDSPLGKFNVDETRQEAENSQKEETHDDAREKYVDSSKSEQVSVPIPRGLNSVKSSHQLSTHIVESSKQPQIAQENVEKNGNFQVEKFHDEIAELEAIENIARTTELIKADEARNEEIGGNDDESVDKEEEEEEEEKEQEKKEQAKDETKNGPVLRSENESKKGEIETSLENSSLPSIFRTNVSLEALKAQAFSLQGRIKNAASLQHLRDKEGEILPEIPKFTENGLLDTLNMFASLKNSPDNSEYSYLSKMDTSMLNERQLKIVRSTEALIPREQRQTFAKNIFECIRGFSILNCMRIFIWPVIADNIPQSFSQNLPTLPIEVNLSDWLPGNQRDKPKSSKLRSATNVSSHQRRIITPELLVMKIWKNALSAKLPGVDSTLPTLIDPTNEKLPKPLTSGELEILKMAETFLPESSRQKYSALRNSCVHRFEYLSCLKYFTWPTGKRHFSASPKFPDYQNGYPSVMQYLGHPILPYSHGEGLGELVKVGNDNAKSRAASYF